MQVGVVAAFLADQLMVVAFFHDLPTIHGDDAMGVAYGGEAVGDDQDGVFLQMSCILFWMIRSDS